MEEFKRGCGNYLWMQIILIVLKILGVFNFEWKWVFTPTWIVALFLVLGLIKYWWENWG